MAIKKESDRLKAKAKREAHWLSEIKQPYHVNSSAYPSQIKAIAEAEANKLKRLKKAAFEALKQRYRESIVNFNFNNLYIIGEKKETDNPNVANYNLTHCHLTETNEIYIDVWDNEKALLKWKNINLIDKQHCAIDSNSFIYLILKNTEIKWALLNPPPEVNDYDTAESIDIEKMMLLSAKGVWPLLEYHLTANGQADHIITLLKQSASNNINMTPNELTSNIDKLIDEQIFSLCTIRAPVEQFEFDIKLEHAILNNILCFDNDRDEIAKASIDLFGHCFKFTYGIYNKVINAVFDSTKELTFKLMDTDDENVKLVILDQIEATLTTQVKLFSHGLIETKLNDNVNITSITLLLNEENLKILSEYFRKNNQIYFLFNKDDDKISSKLLDDSQLVEIGKNFINESPDNFYTDVDCLLIVEACIGASCRNSSILLSSEEKRYACFSEKGSKYESILNSYYEKLVMFSNLLKDESSICDREDNIIVAYSFIYNVVIEHLAQKWENEYQQYFQDIRELNLNEAIERYLLIDTIVHTDNVSLGRFIYYLIKNGKFDNNRNYLTCSESVIPKLNQLMENKKYNNFVNRLKASTISSQIKYSINDVDLMDGLEFEKFIAELFFKMGYQSEITKASGDQGIDVIASKNGNTIGIQTKCYSSSVGNSAIQEAVAGKNHYRLDKAIVVTNNFFTDSARQLAQSNSIILWDRHMLKEKIDESFNSSR